MYYSPRLTRCDVGQVTSINVLLDEILLEIFDYCVDEDGFAEKNEIEAWQSLVHVCRRWRSVVFGSPRRLNLRLVCEAKTPARDTLDVWPPLPIIIRDSSDLAEIDRVDDIIAVLKHSGRVCQTDLSGLSLSSTKKLLAAMQQPFPELTYLRLEGAPTAVPDSFLGGSAPHLRNLWLGPVKFPGLPKLLLSATHLVDLQLGDICHPRSFSLETMATALSILTSLQFLHLNAEFRFARYRPNWASPRPPPTRSLLPVLNMLRYYGVSQYFDDLVAFIDAPRLNKLDITISSYNELNIPRFTQFISSKSMLEALKKTYVVFQDDGAGVKFSSQVSGHGELQVKVPSRTLEEQLWSLEQVYTSCLPPLSTLEDLYIYEVTYQQPDWPDDLGNMPWLELLHRFPTVKNLYLSQEIASRIVPALRESVGSTTTEVLPVLQNISFGGLQPRGPVLEGIEQFVAARQLSGRPITVSTIPRNLMRSWVMMLDYYFDNSYVPSAFEISSQ